MTSGDLRGGVLMTMLRPTQGGADRVAVLLANGFVRAGIPCGIFLLREGGEGRAALLQLLDPAVILRSAGPSLGSRHLDLIRGISAIRREVARSEPALVLASSNNMGLVTRLAAGARSGAGPRYAMKVTNPVVRPRDRGPFLRFYRHHLYGFIFRRYERILTLTLPERDRLSHMYPADAAKFETVPNPYVSQAMLDGTGQRRRSGPPIILALARMMPQKRLDRLLRAFAMANCTDARLVILGDGPERPRLERLSRSLGLAGRVEMPGFVEDVVPWLRRADVYALSSDYEGLPAVVIEALACNVPVVTTNCFDGAEALLAQAEGCFVVPRTDLSAFARALDASLASTGSHNGLREIASGYVIERAVAAHVEELRPLLRPIGRELN